MKLMTSSRILTGLIFAGAALIAPATHAALVFTFENAGVQASTVPGVVTEDFEGALNTIGTLTGGSIRDADKYGGAGGAGKYLFAYTGDAATLTLNTGANYLGLWWSAGDGSNELSFYDAADNLLGFYTSAALASLAPEYYGNPNATFLGQNGGEAYAYLNFTVTGGTAAIAKVVFGGSNFEIDDVSVTADKVTPPGNPTAVPEGGSTIAMMGVGLVGLTALQRRLKKTVTA